MLADRVDRSYEAEMSFGRVLQINDMTNPPVRQKSQDTTATWDNRTETNQQLTIDKQVYCARLFENLAEIQSATPLREGYTAKMGYSITATVEGDASLGLVSLGNGFSQLAGTVGVDPSDDDLLQATQFLADADAPDDGELTFWMSPACYTAIQKIDKFTRSNYVGQSAAEANVRKGALGEIYGAQIFRSSLARNNPSSADTSYNWFFHKRAVALVMQQMPTVHSQYIILEDGWGVYVGSIYNFCERAIPPSTTSSPTSGDQLVVAVGAR